MARSQDIHSQKLRYFGCLISELILNAFTIVVQVVDFKVVDILKNIETVLCDLELIFFPIKIRPTKLLQVNTW